MRVKLRQGSDEPLKLRKPNTCTLGVHILSNQGRSYCYMLFSLVMMTCSLFTCGQFVSCPYFIISNILFSWGNRELKYLGEATSLLLRLDKILLSVLCSCSVMSICGPILAAPLMFHAYQVCHRY